jgi:hypothetical protein
VSLASVLPSNAIEKCTNFWTALLHTPITSPTRHTTGWSKSHATHSWHTFYLSKNKLHWHQKTKNNVKCWKCPERNKVWRISTKLSSLNTEGRPERFLSCTLPVSRKRFTRRDTVDLFGTGESGNVSLNSFWQVK